MKRRFYAAVFSTYSDATAREPNFEAFGVPSPSDHRAFRAYKEFRMHVPLLPLLRRKKSEVWVHTSFPLFRTRSSWLRNRSNDGRRHAGAAENRQPAHSELSNKGHAGARIRDRGKIGHVLFLQAGVRLPRGLGVN